MKNKLSKLIAACLIIVFLAACSGSNSSDDKLDSIHSNRVESDPIEAMGQVDDDFIVIQGSMALLDKEIDVNFLIQINAAIKKGYTPIGPVVILDRAFRIYLYQSMIKKDKQ